MAIKNDMFNTEEDLLKDIDNVLKNNPSLATEILTTVTNNLVNYEAAVNKAREGKSYKAIRDLILIYPIKKVTKKNFPFFISAMECIYGGIEQSSYDRLSSLEKQWIEKAVMILSDTEYLGDCWLNIVNCREFSIRLKELALDTELAKKDK